jgi:glycosyltransferase involved in cell wall biosynthesis
LPVPFLSIIIPAYNEQNRLPVTLEKIDTYLSKQSYSYEVLVVENGSQDKTFEAAVAFASQHLGFRVLQSKERGKGRAVRLGMLEACGEYRFMADADLSMPINEIERFLPPKLTGFDVAIASREAPGAVRYNEPGHRHFVGRGFNLLIRTLALPELNDTQCGFKCFRSEVVPELFDRQTMMGWSFDVELLYIARMLGYRIVEIPIPWYFNPESKIRVLHDSIRMGLDLIAIRWNGLTGKYYAAK